MNPVPSGARHHGAPAICCILMLVASPLMAQSRVLATSVVTPAREPLAGVLVSSAQARTWSDSTGRFSLRVDSDTLHLTFQRTGYRSRTLPASAVTGPIVLEVEPTLLTEVVISSSRTDLGLSTALSSGAVFRAAVAERGGTSLAQRLEGVEGLSVQHMGEWGSRAILRGLGGERLTVMVDGARVNRACTFGMDQGLSTVTPGSVERVEVLSGPGSTLYGSGNVGGVINVVTRRPPSSDGVAGEARAGASSAIPGGTAGLSLGMRRGGTEGLVALDVARYGDYHSSRGRIAGSSYRDGNLSAQFGLTPTTSQRLSWQGSLYEGRDIGWPAMAGATIPTERRQQLAMDYGWQVGRGAVDALAARVYVQRLDHHMEIDMSMPMQGPGGMPMTVRSLTDARSHSTTTGARANVRLLPGLATRFDIGMDATQWAAEATRWNESIRVSGNGTSTPMSETVLRTWPAVRVVDLGVFSQGERDIGRRVSLTSGLRLDHVRRRADGREPTEETIGTGNLGLRALLGRGFSARSAIGLGFRVADPTELYGMALRPDGFIYRGTPALASETNRNLEVSLGWERATSRGRASASATIFRNDLRDLIAPRLALGDTVAGRPVREYANVADARIRGGSAAFELPISVPLGMRGGVSWTHGQNLITATPLALTPPIEAHLALRLTSQWMRSRWVEVEGRAAGRQERIATDAGEQEAAGYGLLNLRGGFALGGVDLLVGVENALDRAYRAHVDPLRLLRPGRNVYVRMARSF